MKSSTLFAIVLWFFIIIPIVLALIFGLHAVIDVCVQIIFIIAIIFIFLFILVYILYRIDKSRGLIKEKDIRKFK